jgi:hypothetical protein
MRVDLALGHDASVSRRRGWIIGAAAGVAVVAVAISVAFAAGWLVQRPHNVGVAFDSTKGVVSGKLFLEVGPRPATPFFGKVALVDVTRIGGAQAYGASAYAAPTSPDGTFSVVVDPGLYEVTGMATATTPLDGGGRRTCTMPRRPVRVNEGDHVTVNVRCDTGWP